ncbi:MAG: glycosyltransferase family 2 protein [Rikenellaceae bacterium]|jgi:glycosyltransferase involved in cell wall biosynthesis|nr:glycosyltransferase family 2 protein [Rikenellaceae bacterium]
MKVSLLISTYNWPEALDLTLTGTAAQSRLPDEILIADDGSREETRRLIDSWRERLPIPLHHLWQEDLGFRAGQIRNKAIAAAAGDYIIQVDGDVFFRRHFICDHVLFAKPGTFVNGSRVNVGPELTARLLSGEKEKVDSWRKGVSNLFNGIRWPLLSPLFARRKSRDLIEVRGCNMAFWREDLLRVGGYNEKMTGWGLEDSELAVRLGKSGVRKRTLKFAGIVYHLYHKERSREHVERNREILRQASKE